MIVDLIGLADPLADALTTPQQIVSEIEREQRLVAVNRNQIDQKIAATLARIWAENETP